MVDLRCTVHCDTSSHKIPKKSSISRHDNLSTGAGGEVLNLVGTGLKFMLEKIGAFIVSIGSFSKSIQKFMEDPSFESFLGIFSENGTFFVGITALTATYLHQNYCLGNH